MGLRLRNSSGNYVELNAPSSIATDVNLTLPNTDGDSGQYLQTNGSGSLSWAAPLGTAAATSGTNFQFNSGYGSVATAYGCRAWVNFNGTGTVAIRASGNVSSITDNTTGSYSVNYSTAMPDADYTTVCSGRYDTNNSFANSTFVELGNVAQTTTSTRIFVRATADGVTAYDNEQVSVAVFR